MSNHTLKEYFEQRTNGIGFLRLALAAVVIIHHSFTLRHGWGSDPLWRISGQVDLGTFAVASFLVLSGFLIAASYEKSTSLSRYLLHRALRLYPGFWVCLLITATIFGPLAWLIERGNIIGYFAARPGGPPQYIMANLSLLIRQKEINGLFTLNPSHYVNGSLWTLSLEALCYLAVPLLAVVGGIGKRRWLALSGWTIGIGWYFVDEGWLMSLGIHFKMFSILRVALFFAGGVVFYAYRDIIPLTRNALAIAFGVLLLSAPFGLLSLALLIGLPYVVFWSAFRLGLPNLERRADLSYGVYIYAYPIQQLIVVSWPNINSGVLLMLAALIVTPVAFLSWTIVEKPALSFKKAGLRPAPIPVPRKPVSPITTVDVAT